MEKKSSTHPPSRSVVVDRMTKKNHCGCVSLSHMILDLGKGYAANILILILSNSLAEWNFKKQMPIHSRAWKKVNM